MSANSFGNFVGKEVATVTLSPSRSGEMLHTPSAMTTSKVPKAEHIPSLTSLQDHLVVHKPFFVLGGKSYRIFEMVTEIFPLTLLAP
jgi:hypothetical protein